MTVLKSITSPSLIRTLLIVLCFTIACTLGHRLYVSKDMTAGAQHTLQTGSIETLTLFSDPLEIEIFINPHEPQLETMNTLLNRYRAHKPDLKITHTDPALDPQRMRQLNVATGGELFIRYKNRTQRLTQISEQTLTLAMQRLSRSKSHSLWFTTGHGERSVERDNNADLATFTQQLTASGFNINTVNLTSQGSLDANDGTLVIAGPLQRFLAREVALILEYISNGGNLIWLTEPDSDDGLKPVAIELGIERLPGVVIDLAAQQLEVDRPDFAIASDYFQHDATQGFTEVTLFPQASGLSYDTDRDWQVTPLVQSSEQAWTETGALNGKVIYGDNPREVNGSIPLVFALQRERNNKQQRVIVAGDGDFLADAWIANGGNRELGNRLFNWSVDDAALMALDTSLQPDTQLDLSRAALLWLASTSLLLLPGTMLGVATGVWYRRQHG